MANRQIFSPLFLTHAAPAHRRTGAPFAKSKDVFNIVDFTFIYYIYYNIYNI